MKKVLLLDGYNLLYRARYSGMDKGEYSAIFNFFRGLRPLIEKFDPDLCYFVLEGKPLKRLSILPEYKGQRVYNDDDNFNVQRNTIIELMKKYFPIKTVFHPGYECDDVIGYLSNKYQKENKVTIISSDTDFIQLISENVDLYNPVKKELVQEFNVDYVSWKALRGDTSDNIQGFKGIGDKRARALQEDSKKLKDFLDIGDNRDKFLKNIELIKLHDLDKDKESDNIMYFDIPETNCWNELKHLFDETYNFKSMVKTEKTWNNYTKTFNKLFGENKNDN